MKLKAEIEKVKYSKTTKKVQKQFNGAQIDFLSNGVGAVKYTQAKKKSAST